MIVPFVVALAAQTSGVPPDVVVVVADDIALSDIAVIDTPNLDVLASQGVSFRRAYAHPICSPTRRSILFGRWPGRVASRTCAGPTYARTPSHSDYGLPKLLKGAGYSTGAFGKWHLSSNFLAGWEVSPHLHGFDVWRAGLPSNVSGCGGNSYFDWTRVDDGVSTNASEYQTFAVRNEYVDWWGATFGARFAYVCYQSAHKPFHIPPNQNQGPPGGEPCTDRGMYRLMVESLDEMIGDMLAVTDLDSTYFIFLADNGTPRSAIRADQDPLKVKRSTFRDGVNVPLIVAGPGVVPGVSDGLVHAVDLMATIAELTGTSIPEHLNLDSHSFAAALEDPWGWRPERRYVFCENDFGIHERAVITQRWKLRDVEGQEELYDLWNDPREEYPLDLDDPRRRDLLLCLRDILNNPSSPACTEIPPK